MARAEGKPGRQKRSFSTTMKIRRAEDTGTMRRPANDDRESIGTILRTLQVSPSRTSYVVASVFAAVWVVGGLGLGWLYLPEIQASLGPTG